VRTLVTVFVAWKLFLFLMAAGSTVGPAYDTSGSITLDVASRGSTCAPAILARLTSWDAIYFTQVARRGYLFEQEWAFGSGLTIVIEYLVNGKPGCSIWLTRPADAPDIASLPPPRGKTTRTSDTPA
jgi:phosphatidylinositol glycan class V